MKSVRLGRASADGREKHALVFEFDDAWTVLNFDEGDPGAPFANPDGPRLANWQFRALWKDGVPRRVCAAPRPSGLRAVDIVAFSPEDETLYLIEGTDYRAAGAMPLPDTLPDEAAAKFRDTLAALAIGKVPRRRSFAALTELLAAARRVVCVLHVVFPADPLLGDEDALNIFERWRGVMRATELPCWCAMDPVTWTVRSEAM